MSNRRGAEITIGTIIIIILALVVLVVLITGFSQGWSNLWDSITNLGGGSSNVDTIIIACQTACQTESVFAYCQQERDVKTGDKEKDAQLTGKTCYQLRNDANLGFEPCPALDNNPACTQAPTNPSVNTDYVAVCSTKTTESSCTSTQQSVIGGGRCVWNAGTNTCSYQAP